MNQLLCHSFWPIDFFFDFSLSCCQFVSISTSHMYTHHTLYDTSRQHDMSCHQWMTSTDTVTDTLTTNSDQMHGVQSKSLSTSSYNKSHALTAATGTLPTCILHRWIHAVNTDRMMNYGFDSLMLELVSQSILLVLLCGKWQQQGTWTNRQASHKGNAPQLSQTSPSQPVMSRFSCTTALPQNPATSVQRSFIIHHCLQSSQQHTCSTPVVGCVHTWTHGDQMTAFTAPVMGHINHYTVNTLNQQDQWQHDPNIAKKISATFQTFGTCYWTYSKAYNNIIWSFYYCYKTTCHDYYHNSDISKSNYGKMPSETNKTICIQLIKKISNNVCKTNRKDEKLYSLLVGFSLTVQ